MSNSRAAVALLLFVTTGAEAKKAVAQAKASLGRSPTPAVEVRAAPARFDPEEAARQIRMRMPAVNACYARIAHDDSSLRGKLQLDFELGGGGQVAATTVELDTLLADIEPELPATLVACVRQQASSWRLAPAESPAGAHVSYTFIFEPRF
jgi:hypothetical protein